METKFQTPYIETEYYDKKTKLYFSTIIIGLILSILVIGIWIFTTPYGFPWFIYPIWGLSMIEALICVQLLQVLEKYYIFHIIAFLLNSLVLFLSNVYIKTTNYPWSMYPIGVLFLILMIHTLFIFDAFDSFRFHLLLYFILNTFCLWTWSFMKIWFPWWSIVFGLTSLLLLIHLIIYKYYQSKQ